MPIKLTPQSGMLECILNSLNVRKGAPSTKVPVIDKLIKGENVRYMDVINDGQPVNGNSKWFKDENGNYIWSGGVKVLLIDPVHTQSPEPVNTDPKISDAVGFGCKNREQDVITVQELLVSKGLKIIVDGQFGSNTGQAIKDFQVGALHFRNPDGVISVNGKTWNGLINPEVIYTAPTSTNSGDFNTKYKDVVFQGSVFPDAPIRTDLSTKFNDSIKNIYIPAMEQALAGAPKGLKLLCTVMASHEGFYPGSRSFRTNNPGNIGNTDAGSNVALTTLQDGILRQQAYLNRIVEGKNAAYPMGKRKLIPSYYSPEIAKNPQYGLPAWLPGYEFVFTGQLDQFVKIYATGARAGNSYLSTIISYLNANGLQANASSKIQDIISTQ